MITFDVIDPGMMNRYRKHEVVNAEVARAYRDYQHAKAEYETLLDTPIAKKSDIKAAKKRMDKAQKKYEKAKKKAAKHTNPAKVILPVRKLITEKSAKTEAAMPNFYDASYSIPLVSAALIVCAVAIHFFGKKKVK